MASDESVGKAGGEDEFEPGSEGKVLRNLFGITDLASIELVESQRLAVAQEAFFDELEVEHRFTVEELCSMHQRWLGDIYPFAGQLRRVDMGKDGFQFASVQFLESNLELFERTVLGTFTPCRVAPVEEIARAMAHVHGEFIMLHPFREGNGRLGRWLADAMAAQAGLPFPLYGFTQADDNGYRAQYLAAVKRAVLAEYEALSRFFAEALYRGLDEGS